MNIKKISVKLITILLISSLLATGCANKNKDNHTASDFNESVSSSLLFSSFPKDFNSGDGSNAEQENIGTEDDSAVSETTDFISSIHSDPGLFVDLPKVTPSGMIMYMSNNGKLYALSEFQNLIIETKDEWQLYFVIDDVVIDKGVTWSSSNPKMVSIDENGMLKANLDYKYMERITAETADGCSAYFNVMGKGLRVLNVLSEKTSGIADLSIFPKDFYLSSDYSFTVDFNTHQQIEMYFYLISNQEIKSYLPNGKILTEYEQYQTLDPFGVPNPYLFDLTWTSSDPSVASVNESGLVTLHRKGRILLEAQISDQNGTFSDYIYINIV